MNDMLELLRELEWAPGGGQYADCVCPSCENTIHTEDCKLNAAIKRLESFENELEKLRNAQPAPI